SRSRRSLFATSPPLFPLPQELTVDADSGEHSETRAFVSELQRDFDTRAREAAAHLAASRAAVEDERQRSLRVHDALHAQLREAVLGREALGERLRLAHAQRDELGAAQPARALQDSHAALLAKLGALKGEGEWDYERAKLRADEVGRENASLRRAVADLRAELDAVVAWRAKQAARGEAPADEVRALASLRAQNGELRRLQYESECERSAMKSRLASLEEELARSAEFMQVAASVPRYQREIRSLRQQLEASAAPPPAPPAAPPSAPPSRPVSRPAGGTPPASPPTNAGPGANAPGARQETPPSSEVSGLKPSMPTVNEPPDDDPDDRARDWQSTQPSPRLPLTPPAQRAPPLPRAPPSPAPPPSPAAPPASAGPGDSAPQGALKGLKPSLGGAQRVNRLRPTNDPPLVFDD
ncbi:hypothetical protein T492DRAFT_417429, partial [Pavlovales sp. CCMP2436]